MAINLKKGSGINLSKENKDKLGAVTMGLGWDVKKAGFLGSLFGGNQPIDLDASCLVFKDNGEIEPVWFRQLRGAGDAVLHSGDNRTGDGDGDDEKIKVIFPMLRADVQHLVFTVNSFTGQSFDKIANAFCRVVNDKGVEIARYDLGPDASGGHTGLILMAISRGTDGDWHCKAIGQPAQGRTWHEMEPQIRQLL